MLELNHAVKPSQFVSRGITTKTHSMILNGKQLLMTRTEDDQENFLKNRRRLILISRPDLLNEMFKFKIVI